MIYTINFNPAVDYYLSFDKFNQGELNFPTNDYKLPGGKGINVSKVLKNYNVDSTCFGFLGGFTGEFIDTKLKEYGVFSSFIRVKDDTRINIKINNNGLESEIAGIAPKITSKNYLDLIQHIKSQLKENDIIVLSGSVPSSIPEDAYAQIIEVLPKSVRVILDTRGSAFDSALKKGVFLVKPNKDELREYFKRDFNTIDDLINGGKELQSLGAKNVIISLGKEGSIFISEDKIYKGGIPKGNLISSVGAGDSMIAGFIYGLVKNFPLEETYKFSIASGSATAFSKGLATYEKTNSLLSDIIIKNIEVGKS
ncbi:1-phosphofructokinase [Cetobacterium sp. 2A]|uniref:1-phosphofructokinase n=1 Tax=Cetobacterium sp. 2A TaxID=2754723 RepID=UPI00163BC312|nr:1-phosphofructokinase [Cetobacterium sp. 2A]MBC2855517.1 1-phosphofructokinase [Cetobacterium sp. 2A]